MRQILSKQIRRYAYKVERLPTVTLGKTGLKVKSLGLGCAKAVSDSSEKEALDIIEAALDVGINYFDTAPEYRNSEERVGKGLKGSREKIIVASKTHDRTYDGSMKLLDDSLKKLKTDHLDLWQVHHLDEAHEVNRIFKKDGAYRALQEAKEDGTVKYIGVTGHSSPEPLMSAIKRGEFDTILMALNMADRFDNSFQKDLLPEAVKRNLGIIGMKIYSSGFLKNKKMNISCQDAFNYVMTLPVSMVVIGNDNPDQIYDNAKIAKTFKKLNDDQMKELENKGKKFKDDLLAFRDW